MNMNVISARSFSILALLVAALFALGGCGGHKDDDGHDHDDHAGESADAHARETPRSPSP